jgi:hypothetical protein
MWKRGALTGKTHGFWIVADTVIHHHKYHPSQPPQHGGGRSFRNSERTICNTRGVDQGKLNRFARYDPAGFH